MNHKYRKKPVVIEAFQMTKERRWDNNDWPGWLGKAWNTDGVGSLFIASGDNPDGSILSVWTMEGPLKVAWGDWIIQGVQGEIYPCKPDIFEQTYEKVDDPQP